MWVLVFIIYCKLFHAFEQFSFEDESGSDFSMVSSRQSAMGQSILGRFNSQVLSRWGKSAGELAHEINSMTASYVSCCMRMSAHQLES